jgi:hypothetical protein
MAIISAFSHTYRAECLGAAAWPGCGSRAAMLIPHCRAICGSGNQLVARGTTAAEFCGSRAAVENGHCRGSSLLLLGERGGSGGRRRIVIVIRQAGRSTPGTQAHWRDRVFV